MKSIYPILAIMMLLVIILSAGTCNNWNNIRCLDDSPNYYDDISNPNTPNLG